MISSISCESSRLLIFKNQESRCKRPNETQKESYKKLMHDLLDSEEYGPAVNWIQEILEEDCFPEEAKEARRG